MAESILSIIKWHEQTFGDAETLEGQMAKFYAESEEWEESKYITDTGEIRGDISELADMAIVGAGIGRFDCVTALNYLAHVYTELYSSSFSEDDLAEAIDAKLAKNRARKWTPQNGSFQHIEE